MPYVNRDKKNKIIFASSLPQFEGQECLPKTDKEIVAFLKKTNEAINKHAENEATINNEMRRLAVESLKKKKEFPSGFKE